MQELGYGSDTLMNKGIFLQVMLYLVGASDPFDDSDAESQVSQSETTSMSESVAGGDLQELMMGIEGGTAMAVASMGNQQVPSPPCLAAVAGCPGGCPGMKMQCM